jgi:hypothetical protein
MAKLEKILNSTEAYDSLGAKLKINGTSSRIQKEMRSRVYGFITHSSSGEAAPQLLATKRLVEDDLAAAATKLASAFAAAGSIMTMVEITVWTLFCSRV